MVDTKGRAAGLAAAVLFSFLSFASDAAAQVAPALPSPALGAAIGAAAAPTREEVTRPEVTPAPRARGRVTVEGGVQRAPCALDDPRFAKLTLTLTAVTFRNLRAVSPDALRPAYADLLGRTVPVAAVCEIRDRAATILRDRGFLAAVQVPPQLIENGVVRFDVLMPKLVSVHVRGDPGRSAELVRATLQRMVGRDTFNVREAERYLLLVRDLPGFDVRLTLRPAGDGVPGDVVADVSVVRQRYALDLSVQDYGSRAVGRWGGLLRGELYDLAGLGDRLSVGVFSTADTSEQQVVQASYDMRVGPEGLTFGTAFTSAWTRPDLPATTPGARLDVHARTVISTNSLRYPLLRTQAASLAVAGGFDVIDQRVRLNGLYLTNDQIRTVFVRLSGDATDAGSIRGAGGFTAAEPHLRAAGTLELREGLNVLHATQRCAIVDGSCANELPPSRLDARPRTAIVRGSAIAEYRPAPKLAVVTSVLGQYAARPLLQFEEFSAGNYTIGRGYDAGAIQGDSGVAVSTEFRYGSLVPRSARAVAVQPYMFVDEAAVWRHGRDFTGPDRDSLASVGGGVRAGWGSRARLDLAVAVPLRYVNRVPGYPGRRGDTRVLLSFTTRLLPWQ